MEQLRELRARANIIARLVLAVTTITELRTTDSAVIVESAGRYETNVPIAPAHALTIDSEDHR